jgi:hypothetical protein
MQRKRPIWTATAALIVSGAIVLTPFWPFIKSYAATILGIGKISTPTIEDLTLDEVIFKHHF